MTEEIIIDVSDCSHKRDDDCMEVPICNEYGDLMGYQSCEAQTLCPYRSQKKIERLEQENKELKETIEAFKTMATVPTRMYNECERERCRYGRALEEIREIVTSAFAKQRPYKEDFTEIETKINEVLGNG